jgi:hypothetical protein
MRSETITLTDAHTGNMAMKNRAKAGGQSDPGQFNLACFVEQAKLDGAGVRRIDRHVDAMGSRTDPQGLWFAVADLHADLHKASVERLRSAVKRSKGSDGLGARAQPIRRENYGISTVSTT